jgi:hypothetical protein
MKLTAPSLGVKQPATESLIAKVVRELAGREDPFAILELDELTYMQVLWTPEGYDLEYQERNIMHHFRLARLVTAAEATLTLQNYLAGDQTWKERLEFVKKDVATWRYRIGYTIGQFVGGFRRGLRQVRDSNKLA